MTLCVKPKTVLGDGAVELCEGEVGGKADTSKPECGGRPKVRHKTTLRNACDGAGKMPAILSLEPVLGHDELGIRRKMSRGGKSRLMRTGS